MKKILLSFGLILAFVLSAGAQPYNNPRPRMPYYPDNIGSIRLHIAGELGLHDPIGIFWHEPPRHYSIGAMAEAQVGRCFSIGLGADFYGSRFRTGNYYGSAFLNTVPVYGNVRLSNPGWAKSFIEARVGYAIPVNRIADGSYAPLVAKGLYTGVGVGFSSFGNNISIGFNTVDLGKTGDKFTDFYIRYSYAIPLN